MVESSFILYGCKLDMLSTGNSFLREMGNRDAAGLFLAVVCIGGFFLFRKMTRKEIFFSSSALVALNIVLGIFTYLTQRIFTSFAMLWSELSEWASVFSQIAFQFGLNEWLSAAIVWILPPYIFLLFGKKEVHTD